MATKYTQGPNPAKHLSREAKKLWRDLNQQYDFELSDLTLLKTALEHYDRLQACREMIAEEGFVVTDPSGRQRAHPALAAEKEARSGFLQSWRLLALDEEPPGPVGRPPGH